MVGDNRSSSNIDVLAAAVSGIVILSVWGCLGGVMSLNDTRMITFWPFKYVRSGFVSAVFVFGRVIYCRVDNLWKVRFPTKR
jgi:hypothetical protein